MPNFSASMSNIASIVGGAGVDPQALPTRLWTVTALRS
jgi:hypothetical protein